MKITSKIFPKKGAQLYKLLKLTTILELYIHKSKIIFFLPQLYLLFPVVGSVEELPADKENRYKVENIL